MREWTIPTTRVHQVEVYVAFHDAAWMQEMFTQLITEVVQSVTGGLTLEYEGQRLDFILVSVARFADAASGVGSLSLDAPSAELAGRHPCSGSSVEKNALGTSCSIAPEVHHRPN